MSAGPAAIVDQQAIQARAEDAAGAGELSDRDVRVAVNNPICGDRITLDIRISDDRIAELAHNVRGCVLCHAAASVIGDHAPGCDSTEIEAVYATVKAMLDGIVEPPAGKWSELAMFAPVAAHRNRHHCVLIPFEALRRALDEATSDN
jgi:NifU-like protein involved in Fe-S cluster formation